MDSEASDSIFLEPDHQPDTYFAGYFDGEGCINFYERPNGIIPRIRISVKSTNLLCVQALQARYKGSVTLASLPSRNRKSQYRWRIGSIRDCLAFIYAIEPHAIEKRVQLATARQWLEHRLAVPRRCRHAAGTARLVQETRIIMSEQKKMDFFVFPIDSSSKTSDS